VWKRYLSSLEKKKNSNSKKLDRALDEGHSIFWSRRDARGPWSGRVRAKALSPTGPRLLFVFGLIGEPWDPNFDDRHSDWQCLQLSRYQSLVAMRRRANFSSCSCRAQTLLLHKR
jgi:hypothetical protein